MPILPNSINLIRTKTSSSPQMAAIELSLRRSGYIGFIGFICVAFVLAIVYFFMYTQSQNLEHEKVQLLDRINSQKNKEGLLLAIKDRTKIVDKAMGDQKPWSQVLDLVAKFSSPPAMTNLSVNEQNTVTFTAQVGSLEEASSMVNTIIKQTYDKRLRNPQLSSLQFGKEGQIFISISFFALFPTVL